MTALTIGHTLISLFAIGAGLVVVVGLLRSKRLDGWTIAFLWLTAATCVTGYFFPFEHITPAQVLGVITLASVALAYVARSRRYLAGHWRAIYTGAAVASLYFNVFVLVVQLFKHVPALHALAPTQSEMPFKVTQAAVFVVFVGLGIAAAKRFHPPIDSKHVTGSAAGTPPIAH
jgi:Ca2+/Na+ antiporter